MIKPVVVEEGLEEEEELIALVEKRLEVVEEGVNRDLDGIEEEANDEEASDGVVVGLVADDDAASSFHRDAVDVVDVAVDVVVAFADVVVDASAFAFSFVDASALDVLDVLASSFVEEDHSDAAFADVAGESSAEDVAVVALPLEVQHSPALSSLVVCGSLLPVT